MPSNPGTRFIIVTLLVAAGIGSALAFLFPNQLINPFADNLEQPTSQNQFNVPIVRDNLRDESENNSESPEDTNESEVPTQSFNSNVSEEENKQPIKALW